MELNLKELNRKYKRVKVDRTLTKLVKNKVEFYIRKGTECNELIYDGNHRIFANSNSNFPSDLIYLFGIVQNECQRFLNKYPIIDLPPKVPVTNYNYQYDHDKGVLTGTDLNHAFWRIAYVKGYISKKTYDRGLDDRAKALRLATISVLGREKLYDKYVDGVYLETVVGRKHNRQLQMIYEDVRFSCYYMMYELSQKLGEDFDCWRTDCIYYRDTPENRTLVNGYFEEREMLFKQLVFNTTENQETTDEEENK